MKSKFLITAILAGLVINILFIVIPTSHQTAFYRGFKEPNASDFIYKQEELCAGVNYKVERSIHKTGYPFRSAIKMDFNDCTAPKTNISAIVLFSRSTLTVPFYINLFIWAAISYAALLLVRRYLSLKK